MRKAAFLDRDGTINIEKDYLYKAEDIEYVQGAIEGLKQLQDWGYLLVIVTNQSGIARGYYTEEDFHRLTDWMFRDLKNRGINIAKTYYCPHHPEGKMEKYRKTCNCRKPGTGMFYRAAEELAINLDQSIAIGDKWRDLQVCRETGAKGFLLTDCKEETEGITSCKSWEEIISSIGRMQRDNNA